MLVSCVLAINRTLRAYPSPVFFSPPFVLSKKGRIVVVSGEKKEKKSIL